MFYYVLKSARLFFIILCVSYFFGMMFRILNEAEEDIMGHVVLTYCDQAGGYFVSCEGTWAWVRSSQIVILKYFSFTTLCTVGFGDFYPHSDAERLLIAFGMLGGVAIFSSILGNFIEMLDTVKSFSEDYQDFDRLNKFIGAIKHFNNNIDMEIGLRKQIEEYFEHRWISYKNLGLGEDDA